MPNCAGQLSCCESEQKSSQPLLFKQAAFPAAWVKQAKFWPSVARVDDVYGDRQLIARWVRWAHAASAVTGCGRGLASMSHCMTLEKQVVLLRPSCKPVPLHGPEAANTDMARLMFAAYRRMRSSQLRRLPDEARVRAGGQKGRRHIAGLQAVAGHDRLEIASASGMRQRQWEGDDFCAALRSVGALSLGNL